jgi:hypothetical protein
MRADHSREFERLEARLDALERAVTDGESDTGDVHPSHHTPPEGPDAESPTEVATGLADLTDRVAELEADLEAVRGLLDGVQAVDDDVERRANLALAKAESVEAAVADETGLAVERVPVAAADAADDGPDRPAGADAPRDADDETGDGETSLAARLREAL